MTKTERKTTSPDPDVQQALAPLSNQAVKVLVDNHRQFRAFLTKRLGNEADADEILQQSLKKALERPPSATENVGVLGWFYQVLRNALTDHYRAKATDHRKLDELSASMLALGEGQTAAADELKSEVCQCMKSLLPTLKPEYAQLLARVDLGDETADAVAAGLGISRSNLDVRLHRARKALKTSLERACGTCTTHGCLDCSCG